MLVNGGIELLTEGECRELLGTEQIGRVGLSMGALPAIFPVNYRMIGGDILFRTGEGSKRFAALQGSVVGFEVDRIDPATATGWSVLVVGVAREVGGDDEAPPGSDGIVPWAGGDRSHLIRIHPEVVSGRRIRPAT